jgi:hypothetical protein
VDSGDAFAGDREHAEWVVVPQVSFGGEREPGQIVERPDVIGLDAGLIEAGPVVSDVLVCVADGTGESRGLHGAELVKTRGLDGFESGHRCGSLRAGRLPRLGGMTVRASWLLAGVGGETGGCDAGDGACFVGVGLVAADANGADDRGVAVADKDATGDRHQVALGQCDEGVDELRMALCARGQRPAAHGHAQCAECLRPSDTFAQETRATLTSERGQVASSLRILRSQYQFSQHQPWVFTTVIV